MNIYDTANKLASEIRTSDEYKKFADVKKKIANNPEKRELMDEFERTRYEIQLNTMQTGVEDQVRIQSLENKYMELIQDEEIKEYFELEMKFNVIIADVNKIIAEAVRDVL